MVYGLFNGPDFPLTDHSQVGQTLFDTPLSGPRPPIELGLAEACGQFVGLSGNAFKYLTVLFEFREHHPEL